MSKNQGVIQLMHPGGEASRGKRVHITEYYLRGWNISGCHNRKYMYATGDYLEGGKLHTNETIHFWGEWEPESICKAISHKKESPKTLHKPIFIEGKDRKNGINILGEHFSLETGNNRLNTDPFVFGDTFYYTCCHKKQLSGLSKGDILLFGSVKKKPCTKFLLDTVLVVDNTDVKVNGGFIKNNRIFYETVVAPTEDYEAGGCIKAQKVSFVISGAMYHNGSRPFSFVPFKKESEGKYYERLEFTKDNPLPNCKMCFNSQGFGYVRLDTGNDKIEFWNYLKNYCEKQGFCLGVNIGLPAQVQNNILSL